MGKIRRLLSDLQFLANGSCSFGGTRILDANDLDEVHDATQIIFAVFGAGEAFYVNRDSGVRLFLLEVRFGFLSENSLRGLSCVSGAELRH